MANSKLPSYVDHVDAAGRRFYKQDFIDGVRNDILTGRATVRELRDRYHLSESVIRNWRNGNGQPKTGPRRSVAELDGPSLLDKALAYQGEASKADERIAEYIELGVAYVNGRISLEAVKQALGKSQDRKFMVTTWLGSVFAGAVRTGRIK